VEETLDDFTFRVSQSVEDQRYYASMADAFYGRLKESIKAAESELDEGEILLIYYYCPSGEPILVEGIGYRNTNLMRLYGVDEEDNECTVLVHVNNFHLVLKVIKEQEVEDENVRRRPVGFTGESRPTISSSD
jgi:hypothetical protein